jgi:hypothetical protein
VTKINKCLNLEIFKFFVKKPFEEKIKKKKSQKKPKKHSDKSINDFFTAEQKHKEHMEKQEMEIFEHLKNQTKKILDKNE